MIEQYRGKYLKDIGDAVLASFSSAGDAVSCALAIQKALSDNQGLTLRIGIHLGDITFKDQDVFGDGVNIASRIQSIADPGGIYISESMHKAIRGRSDIQAQYLGETQLKNVDYLSRHTFFKEQTCQYLKSKMIKDCQVAFWLRYSDGGFFKLEQPM